MKNKMTIKEFLENGYKFVNGDKFLGRYGSVFVVGADCPLNMANKKDDLDDLLFIISAKALQSRTKTTYENVTFNKLSEAFAEHEKEPLRFSVGDRYMKLDAESLVNIFNDSNENIYRKVETKITPMQAAKEACKNAIGNDNYNEEFEGFLSETEGSFADLYDKGFVTICRAIVNAHDGE